MTVPKKIRNLDDLSAAELVTLGRPEMSEFARIETELIEAEIEDVERQLYENPKKVADGPIRGDVIYQLGLLAGLRFRGKLLAEARAKLESFISAEEETHGVVK